MGLGVFTCPPPAPHVMTEAIRQQVQAHIRGLEREVTPLEMDVRTTVALFRTAQAQKKAAQEVYEQLRLQAKAAQAREKAAQQAYEQLHRVIDHQVNTLKMLELCEREPSLRFNLRAFVAYSADLASGVRDIPQLALLPGQTPEEYRQLCKKRALVYTWALNAWGGA